MRLCGNVYFSSRFCSFSRIRLRRRGASVTISLAVRKVRTNAFLFRQILRSQVPRRRAEPQSFLFQRSLPMNISYDSYRVFYYAAKYRSFSQAAAALYSNQPNVTRMIRKLESELGCALFFRSPQGVRPTPEGRSSTRTSPSRLRASRQAKRRSSPTRACKAVSSTSQRAALPCARGFCRCSRATGAHTRTCASA